jgi:hypothetical protein
MFREANSGARCAARCNGAGRTQSLVFRRDPMPLTGGARAPLRKSLTRNYFRLLAARVLHPGDGAGPNKPFRFDRCGHATTPRAAQKRVNGEQDGPGKDHVFSPE